MCRSERLVYDSVRIARPSVTANGGGDWCGALSVCAPVAALRAFRHTHVPFTVETISQQANDNGASFSLYHLTGPSGGGGCRLSGDTGIPVGWNRRRGGAVRRAQQPRAVSGVQRAGHDRGFRRQV